MTNKITPFLWFDTQALQAALFYVSIFKDSRITDPDFNALRSITDNDESQIQSVAFELQGQPFIAFNGGPYFKFNPAISMFVNCEDQAEVDYLWDSLTQDGEASQCGWLSDKYGISWQIVPSRLPELLNHPDPIKAQSVMEAMLKMTKINIAELEKAAQ